MYKYNEYHCAACGKFFPIGEEFILRDNCYRDMVHEKCPYCGHLDSLEDVYDDPFAAGKMLSPHDGIK